MTRLRTVAALFPTVALILTLGGCKDESKPAAGFAGTPLRFDPTEEYKLVEWWTNGDLLLHLKPTFAYDLYAGRDRYRTPIERGQWSQKTYASLQFEPYSILGARVERVAIDKDSKGYLVLVIRDLKPFAGLDGPPEVLADHLLGAWEGRNHTLLLRSDGRYRFDHVGTQTGGGAVSGHDGWWEVADQSLILRPDAVGLPATVIRVVAIDNEISLEGMQRR